MLWRKSGDRRVLLSLRLRAMGLRDTRGCDTSEYTLSSQMGEMRHLQVEEHMGSWVTLPGTDPAAPSGASP